MTDKKAAKAEKAEQPLEFVVIGAKLRQYIEGEQAKVKFVRLFSVPDNPRAVDTMVEFMALVSDWTEYQLGELTIGELMEIWKDMRLEVEQIAVDPTPEESSEIGDSKPKTKSPDGA